MCIDNAPHISALADITLGIFKMKNGTENPMLSWYSLRKLWDARGPTDIVLASSLHKEVTIYNFNFPNELEGGGLEK